LRFLSLASAPIFLKRALIAREFALCYQGNCAQQLLPSRNEHCEWRAERTEAAVPCVARCGRRPRRDSVKHYRGEARHHENPLEATFSNGLRQNEAGTPNFVVFSELLRALEIEILPCGSTDRAKWRTLFVAKGSPAAADSDLCATLHTLLATMLLRAFFIRRYIICFWVPPLFLFGKNK